MSSLGWVLMVLDFLLWISMMSQLSNALSYVYFRLFPPLTSFQICQQCGYWIFEIFQYFVNAPNKPGVTGRRSIGFQIVQYSYFTDSKRSWPPISTQHSYEPHTSLHKLPEKHILWVFLIAHSTSGWVLILSKIFRLKNMDLQL